MTGFKEGDKVRWNAPVPGMPNVSQIREGLLLDENVGRGSLAGYAVVAVLSASSGVPLHELPIILIRSELLSSPPVVAKNP